MMNGNICPGWLRRIQKTFRAGAMKQQSTIFRPDCINAAFIFKKELYYCNCYSVKIIKGSKFLGQVKESKDGH